MNLAKITLITGCLCLSTLAPAQQAMEHSMTNHPMGCRWVTNTTGLVSLQPMKNSLKPPACSKSLGMQLPNTRMCAQLKPTGSGHSALMFQVWAFTT